MMTLTEIEKALAAINGAKWHYDESADWDGNVTALAYVGEDVLTTGDGLTVEALRFIGNAPEYVRTLLAIAQAAAKFDESNFVQFNPETDKYEYSQPNQL